MKTMTRRESIVALTGVLLSVVIVRVSRTQSVDSLTPEMAKAKVFKSVRWAQSADDPSVGVGATMTTLGDRLSSFFGAQTGRYLTDQVTYQDTAPPGWDVNDQPLYDQFAAIFKGAQTFEAILETDVRMVVRSYSEYKAAVFLDQDGNIVSTALTFDYCPPGGVTQVIGGHAVKSQCLWPFSAVVFFHGNKPDPTIAAAWHLYIESLSLTREREQASRMSVNGKVNIKVFARKLN